MLSGLVSHVLGHPGSLACAAQGFVRRWAQCALGCICSPPSTASSVVFSIAGLSQIATVGSDLSILRTLRPEFWKQSRLRNRSARRVISLGQLVSQLAHVFPYKRPP